MGTREGDEQAEAERERQEQLQQQERPGSARDLQVEGENETANSPVIINK